MARFAVIRTRFAPDLLFAIQLLSEQAKRRISSQSHQQLTSASAAWFSGHCPAAALPGHNAPRMAHCTQPAGVIQAGAKAAAVVKIYLSAQKFFLNFDFSKLFPSSNLHRELQVQNSLNLWIIGAESRRYT
jgi:hypothetical protein